MVLMWGSVRVDVWDPRSYRRDVVPIDAAAPTREAQGSEHAGCVAAVVEHPDHLLRPGAAAGGVECLRVAVYPSRTSTSLQPAGRADYPDVGIGASMLADDLLRRGPGRIGAAWLDREQSGYDVEHRLHLRDHGIPAGVVDAQESRVRGLGHPEQLRRRSSRRAAGVLPLHHILPATSGGGDSGAQTAFCDDPGGGGGLSRCADLFGAAVDLERMWAQVERAVSAQGAWRVGNCGHGAARVRSMERAGVTPS